MTKLWQRMFEFDSVGKGIALFFLLQISLIKEMRKASLSHYWVLYKQTRSCFLTRRVGTACLGFVAPSRHVCRHAFQVEKRNICLEKGAVLECLCTVKAAVLKYEKASEPAAKHGWCSLSEHIPKKPFFSLQKSILGTSQRFLSEEEKTNDCKRVKFFTLKFCK